MDPNKRWSLLSPTHCVVSDHRNHVRSRVVIYVFICALAILLINLISSARDLSGLLRWFSTPSSLVSVSACCFWRLGKKRKEQKAIKWFCFFLYMTIAYSTHFRSLPPLPHDLVKGMRSIIRSTAISHLSCISNREWRMMSQESCCQWIFGCLVRYPARELAYSKDGLCFT